MAESKSPRRGRPRGATKVQDSVSFDKETKEMLNRIVSTRDMGKSDFINSVVKEAATHVIGEDKPMVLTVTNFKGGAAKTITSACLAVCFAQAGRKVLAIDLDPQANLSQYFRVVDPTFKEPTITDVMLTLTPNGRRKTLDEVIKKTAYENISIVPSSITFQNADIKMSAEGGGIDTRLQHAIEDLKDHYDYVIIDCPPNLGLTVSNAIVALDAGRTESMAIIPVCVDGFGILGLDQTVDTIKTIIEDRRTFPHSWKILMTKVERNTEAYVEGCKTIAQIADESQVFQTQISKATAVASSTLKMEPVITYKPSSKPSKEYKELAKEIEALRG